MSTPLDASAPSAAPAPGPASAPPATPPPNPLKGPNRTLLIVGAVVAVVVVVLLVLVFLVPSSPSSSGGGPSTAETYSQALPGATSAVSGFGGGGWALVLSVGFVTNTTTTLPVNETSILADGCNLTTVSSATTITIPGSSVNRSAGTSPAWEFAYRNASDGIALVDVTSGTASVLGTISGSCTSLFGFLSVVPANVIDSSTAAAAVEPAASAFLRANPSAGAEFALVGGVSFGTESVGPEWEVAYSTCPVSPTASGTGTEFNATVNGLTGEVLYSATNTIDCGSSTTTPTTYPLGTAVSFSSVSSQSSPPYTNYTFAVEAAGDGVTWDNLTAQVQSDGIEVTSGWTLSAVSLSDTPIATYDPATSTWSAEGIQPIFAGNSLLLSATSNLSGDTLILSGLGEFTGSITLIL